MQYAEAVQLSHDHISGEGEGVSKQNYYFPSQGGEGWSRDGRELIMHKEPVFFILHQNQLINTQYLKKSEDTQYIRK